MNFICNNKAVEGGEGKGKRASKQSSETINKDNREAAAQWASAISMQRKKDSIAKGNSSKAETTRGWRALQSALISRQMASQMITITMRYR